ncbi:11069_t:CDS:2 [Funneliformis geosporum]|uniref:1035_t:CDS:1 n=1 Tax=Funneliformis geosporum TaxID=1117311 RepID=A0A9W4X2A5_9GLOM|nr:11069_t:CDS:2 [Funneliformis geosporum]CAI2181235.1 1035_t:CDS:2 [Funneliformis geosporum]
MSIKAEGNPCPNCSTRLKCYFINLNEKVLICPKKKCLFPFDKADISPYVIKSGSLIGKERIGESSSHIKSTQPLVRSNKEESFNPPNEDASNFPENSIFNQNNSITLKTLGVTLRDDPTNKNKLQPNSSQGLSTDTSSNSVENDLEMLFNKFPMPTTEGSLSDATAGNGLLNINTTGEAGNGNSLTVGEYTRMLFGQSGIDMNLDMFSLNSDIMGISIQGNNVNMELDELLGTFDPLE